MNGWDPFLEAYKDLEDEHQKVKGLFEEAMNKISKWVEPETLAPYWVEYLKTTHGEEYEIKEWEEVLNG